MTKLEELEGKLKRYQKKYSRLLKADKAASSRYGDEFRDIQLRVIESMITEIRKEIILLKRGERKPV
jgi:hypothetical protein